MIEAQIQPPQSSKETDASRRRPFPRYQKAVMGLRNYWYPAMLAGRVKKKPVPIKMLGEELMVLREGDKVYCLQGRCAHRGVPLWEGNREFPCTITCAYHGWTYDLRDGKLVAALTDGPESSVVGRVKIKSYPAQERQGVIWVFVGEGEAPPLENDVFPDFLEEGALLGARVFEWEGNWRLAMEGAIDPSHPFYLHRMAWLSKTFDMIAARGRHWPEIINDKWITYRTDPPVPEAEFPGLGRWPRKRWWHRQHMNKLDVYGALPCASKVVNLNFNLPFVTFSWYVPIDGKRYRWFTFLLAPKKDIPGLKRVWAWLKYWLWLRWMYQGQFLRQDSWMNEIMHPFYEEQDGWVKERMFRPDVVLTAWRKLIEEHARGIQEKPSL
jgi:phenylpropionate dioxygenase-like ring-hydroxylating dioxygenase large terminal subunit